jgi:hypothetical protein
VPPASTSASRPPSATATPLPPASVLALPTAPLHTPLPTPNSISRTSLRLPTRVTSCLHSPEPWSASPHFAMLTSPLPSPSTMSRPNQAGATILKGWHDPGGANDWHFPLIDDDQNSGNNPLFPSDDELLGIIFSNNDPCPVPPSPLLPPATPVPYFYWDRIKHVKQPARTIQMLYQAQLDNGLVTTQEQSKRQRKENRACSTLSNLNTTSSYPCSHPHPLPPPRLYSGLHQKKGYCSPGRKKKRM